MVKKISVSVLFLVINLLFAVNTTGNGDGGKKPIGIDFFLDVKTISNIQVENGNIFFILSQIKKEGGNSNDLYQLINGKPVRLSKNVSDYFFRNGKIIFRGARENKDLEKIKEGEQLTIFQQLSTGYQEADEWLRLPVKTGQIEWIEKDRFFYTYSYDHHFELLLKESNGDRKEALKKKEENKNFRIFDELPFWSNGRGDVSGQRTHLYYYNKGVSKLLSETFENTSSPKVSPNKKIAVYTRRDAYYGKVPETGNRLIVLDIETLKTKEINLFDKASYGGIEFINDDEIFLTINRGREHDKIENSGLYRYNLRTEKLTEIYDGSLYGVGNSIGSDVGRGGRAKVTFDKDGVRFVTTVVDYAPLIHIAYKDGKVTFLTPKGINIQEYVPYKDGFLAVGIVGQQGSEIYYIDKKGNYSPLTSINKPVFDEHKIVKPIEITYVNEDNRTLKGYILPPADYEKGKKYPAILDIHGGPKTTYGTVFFHEMQYWANQGYAVLFTNPTGSDGQGSEFTNIRGKVVDTDYRDILAFVDAALEQIDFIDSERLGVTGGSYGGLMTNWIIGHTNRFKAAVSQRGISSWLSFSNTSDIGFSFTYNYWGTNIWENGQLLWERSPLKYADQVKTPTLFIHSEEDYRCWLVEGLQMYYALQYFEVPTRIVVFKNENHELSRSGKPANRIKRLSEITGWFDKYLK
ncbi:MAG: S9 family peptidase [Flavobacteriaceae bacterium]|jgi:dipeptidyl aminopeptidase/acylaminoacyl peptidase|nr:S9 family peptidase [Flavobacteriaceae bacterium]